MAKNIVLIMTDQQHFDSLGANGTPEARTPYIDALAQKGAGYKTAHFGKLHLTHILDRKEEMPHEAGYRNVLDEAHHLSTFITEQALSWVEKEQKDNPFFLSIGFFDPHHHFNPCDLYFSEFEHAEVGEPKFHPDSRQTRPEHLQGRVGDEKKSEVTREMRRAFHAMMGHIDTCVGRLVEGLERKGVVDGRRLL
jgi:arylsulfatase A-like enzyme